MTYIYPSGVVYGVFQCTIRIKSWFPEDFSTKDNKDVRAYCTRDEADSDSILNMCRCRKRVDVPHQYM